MTEQHEETVLLSWARDADGDAQRFTGENIYHRAATWCLDRLVRGIPTISTFHWRIHGMCVTSELVIVPMGSAPIMRMPEPDELTQLAPDFVLMTYKRAEDG